MFCIISFKSEDDSETSTSLLNSPVTAGPRSPTLSAVGSPAHSSPCHNVFADHSVSEVHTFSSSFFYL